MYILGIAITTASDISTDLVTSNQLTDYSFVTQPFILDSTDNAIFRCVSGLGPFGPYTNLFLGGWYFNGTKIAIGGCPGPIFEVRGELAPGVFSLHLCRTFSTTAEGVYSCMMMNSSMTIQTTRVGVYLNGRSELLDMYVPPSPYC